MGGIILTIVIGVVAGFLGGLIVKGGGMGFIWNLIVGILGSFIGDWLLAGKLTIFGGVLDQIIVSTIGAVILLLVLSLFTRGKKR